MGHNLLCSITKYTNGLANMSTYLTLNVFVSVFPIHLRNAHILTSLLVAMMMIPKVPKTLSNSSLRTRTSTPIMFLVLLLPKFLNILLMSTILFWLFIHFFLKDYCFYDVWKLNHQHGYTRENSLINYFSP